MIRTLHYTTYIKNIDKTLAATFICYNKQNKKKYKRFFIEIKFNFNIFI